MGKATKVALRRLVRSSLVIRFWVEGDVLRMVRVQSGCGAVGVMAKMVRLERTTTREIFPHELLESASARLNERIAKATKHGPTAGWYLDAIAGVTLLAFVNEAVINVVGEVKVAGWNPKWSAEKRFEKICSGYFPLTSRVDEPIKTVHEIREIRNALGHAMPIRFGPTTEVVVEDANDFESFHDLDHPIDKRITIASYMRFVTNSQSFRDALRQNSGITYWETKTKSEVTTTYLGDVD